MARRAGGSFDTSKMRAPSLEALAHVTFGLVVVSYDAPETLRNTIASWRDGGLLEFADDKVAFLNAAQSEEISLAHDAGFRVYTPAKDEVAALLARHRTWLSQFDDVPASKLFPATRDVNNAPATMVAPSQIMSYLEMAVDVILFAEKDYVLAPAPREQTARNLLAGIALLQSGTNVVRLRRLDDENREAIQDCCNTGVCGNSWTNFEGASCNWHGHLNWLAIFCDTAGVEKRSKGKVKMCLDEQPQDAAIITLDNGVVVEPMRTYCFSQDESGWSNNVAMFGRKWWVAALGHGAVLTEGDNGMFELNMVSICDYLPRNGLGAGPDGRSRAQVCQLGPGMFIHRELEKHLDNGATRVKS